MGSSLPERDGLQPIVDGVALPGVGGSGGSGAPPTIHEHQAVASYPPGIVIPNLALQGPFGVDVAQPMIDQVARECIAQEEWHEPEVESEIPTGNASSDMCRFHIGTPKGTVAVPLDHDLSLPPSSKQLDSPRTPRRGARSQPSDSRRVARQRDDHSWLKPQSMVAESSAWTPMKTIINPGS